MTAATTKPEGGGGRRTSFAMLYERNSMVRHRAPPPRVQRRLGGHPVQLVQQCDDDRVATDLSDTGDRGPNACFIDRFIFAAVGKNSPPDLKDLFLGYQRYRPARKQIIRIRHLESGNFQNVFEILGREQAEIDAFALDDRVHADRGTVREIGNVAGLDSITIVQCLKARHDFRSRLVRSRQHFQRADCPARLIEGAKISECAADVDANAIPHTRTLPPNLIRAKIYYMGAPKA